MIIHCMLVLVLFGYQDVDGKIISVSLKGTKIDVLPKLVDLVVSDPEQTKQNLMDQGGTSVMENDNGSWIILQGVEYRVFSHDQSNVDSNGLLFSTDTIIYVMEISDESEIPAFARRYGLVETTSTRVNHGNKKKLYQASAGYYVEFTWKSVALHCPIHIMDFEHGNGDTCPDCGSTLIPTEIFR